MYKMPFKLENLYIFFLSLTQNINRNLTNEQLLGFLDLKLFFITNLCEIIPQLQQLELHCLRKMHFCGLKLLKPELTILNVPLLNESSFLLA